MNRCPATIAALLLTLALVCAPSRQRGRALAAQPPATGPGTEDAARARNLLRASATVKANLQELLGQRFSRPVTIKVISRNEVRAILREELDRQMPPKEIRFSQAAMIRLGLLPPGFGLRAALLRMLQEQVGGFYVPRRKALYLILGVPLQSVITAHELTHALQDQQFDLERMMRARKHDDDRALALQAVAEGEAVLSMSLYMARYMSGWEALGGTLTSAITSLGQSASLHDLPLIMSQRLLFPYISGQHFTTIALRRGGWPAVRALFKDPPRSSEQILHPSKYYGRRDRPTTIDLTPLARELGAHWRSLGENDLGELGVSLLLRSLGVKALRAAVCAQGWDGDRFTLLTRAAADGGAQKSPVPGATGAAPADKQRALVWLSTWDSPGHAYRFFAAYGKALSAHLRRQPLSSKAHKCRWTGDNGGGILLCRWGSEVLLLQSPSGEIEVRLRAALTRLKRDGKLFGHDHRGDAIAPGP